MKILVAITGASGALYAQRLLDNLDPRAHEIHVVLSNYAQQVIAEELPDGLKLPDGVKLHNAEKHERAVRQRLESAGRDGRHSLHDGHDGPHRARLQRGCFAARRRRGVEGKAKIDSRPARNAVEPVHVKNMELLLLAGAIILPANPSFYSGAKTVRKSWTPSSRACWIISACRKSSRRAGRRKRNEMKNGKHRTSSIEHRTLNETADEGWVLRDGAVDSRKFDLENRLLEFASAVIDLTEKLPSSRAGNHIAGQILRSGTSPYPNHGEAESAESRDDFIHKLKICLKELRETRRWARLVERKTLGKE